MVAASETFNARELGEQSIQARGHRTGKGEGAPYGWFDLSNMVNSQIVNPWPSNLRDRELRLFVRKEGTDIVSGTIAQMQMRATAFPWQIMLDEAWIKANEVSEQEQTRLLNDVDRYTQILQNADLGEGWDTFIEKLLEDYHVTDKGYFVELQGPNADKTKPLIRVDGINWLDSLRCWRTGWRDFPVAYFDDDGNWHKLHWTRVQYMSSMPSTFVQHHGFGYCATSRVLSAAEILRGVSNYKREKLRASPRPGILSMGNLTFAQVEDFLEDAGLEQESEGAEFFNRLLVAYAQDPEVGTSVNLLEFSNADWFNQESEYRVFVNVVALCFGVDPQDIWPLTGGQMGTGTQSEVLHQKGRGKGVASFMYKVSKMINQRVLPQGLKFEIETRDLEDNKQEAELNALHLDNAAKKVSLGVPSVNVLQDLVEKGVVDADELVPVEGPTELGTDEGGAAGQVGEGDAGKQEQEQDTDDDDDENGSAEGQEKKVRAVLMATQKFLSDFESGRIKADPVFTITKVSGEYAKLRTTYYNAQARHLQSAAANFPRPAVQFIARMQDTIDKYFPQAYVMGLRAGGLNVRNLQSEEVSAEEVRRITFEMGREREFVPRFVNDMQIALANEPTQRGKREVRDQFLERLEMWAIKLDGIYNLGLISAQANQMMEWVLGPTEHCVSCLAASKQIHRAGTWLAAGILPKSKNLECGGWRCECEFKETTAKAKGRIRSIPLFRPSGGSFTAGGELAAHFFTDASGRDLRDRAA